MKTLKILILLIASTSISFAQKAEYFVSANTNFINPASYISRLALHKISPIEYDTEEYVFGIGIERRTKMIYT